MGTLLETYAQTPPSIGIFNADDHDRSSCAWLPGEGQQGLVIAGGLFADPDSAMMELWHELWGDLEKWKGFWNASQDIRDLFTYAGYSYAERANACYTSFPHATLLTKRLSALDLPRQHRPPRFAAFAGEEFAPHVLATRLKTFGRFLMATGGEVAVHDATSHAAAQCLIPPGDMSRLRRKSRHVLGDSDKEIIAFANILEYNIDLYELGDWVGKALAKETEQTRMSKELPAGSEEFWRFAVENIQRSTGDLNEQLIAYEYKTVRLREHVLMLCAAARQAQLTAQPFPSAID